MARQDVKQVIVVTAYCNGKPVGYIKSISYAKQDYSITTSFQECRTFRNPDEVQYAIDFMAGCPKTLKCGYVFTYEYKIKRVGWRDNLWESI